MKESTLASEIIHGDCEGFGHYGQPKMIRRLLVFTNVSNCN